METQSDAGAALDSIAGDRARIAERMSAETWWAAPLQGVAAGLVIVAPAAGTFGPFGIALVLAASTWLFIGAEWLFRKRSGLSISRPAGPVGVVVLAVFIVVMCGLFVASFTLWVFDHVLGIVSLAVVGALLCTLAVVAYDRVYAWEVRRAR